MVAMIQAHDVTLRMSEGKRLHGRPIGRWDDDIKTKLK
jgi:hypothetical protein